MKDKIKYLIHKLFIYTKVDFNNPLVLSSLTYLLQKYYPDFSLKDIRHILENTYHTSYSYQNINIHILGFNYQIINKDDYNELYLIMKKSLIYSDSFEP